MQIPDNLKYTKEHEWVKLEGDTATIGITDYAQGELGDVVFVELPEIGRELATMESFGTIEAVKAVSELFIPLAGKVLEINSALEDDSSIINSDPYGDGWMIKLEGVSNSDMSNLLSAEDYQKLIED